MKSLLSSQGDEASMVLDRLNLDLMYLKSVCVLHRTYITHERSNPAYRYSRKTCIDAALQILEYQTDLHAACQPGGQFDKDQWMVSSLILYDFLLAAMITCLDLYESCNSTPKTSLDDLKVQADRYDLLEHTRNIWVYRREFSRNARRASNVLGVLLSKITRPAVPSTAASRPQESVFNLPSNGLDSAVAPPLPGNSSRDSTGFPPPGEEFGFGNDGVLDFSSALFTESDHIDWEWVDQYLIDRGVMSDLPLEWEK